jgi:hypothetical protein
VGWNWGYVLQSSESDDSAVSIVYGQVTDAARSKSVTDLVLMVWQGQRLTHAFFDEAVGFEALGRFEGRMSTVPGAMALLSPARFAMAPDRLLVEAKDGGDFIRMDYKVLEAMRFLIFNPSSSSYTAVAELLGDYSVNGELDGRAFSFRSVAFAELAGTGVFTHRPRVTLGV